MKAFFVTWKGNNHGIGNRKLRNRLCIGDPVRTHTRIALAEELLEETRINNITPRSQYVHHVTHGKSRNKLVTTLVPDEPNNRDALLLVSVPPYTARGDATEWWSIRHKEAQGWRERGGKRRNGRLLWQGIMQYAYGEATDRQGTPIVKRLLVLRERSGFIIARRNDGFCVYWNGFNLDQTPILPLPDLDARIASVLTERAA